MNIQLNIKTRYIYYTSMIYGRNFLWNYFSLFHIKATCNRYVRIGTHEEIQDKLLITVIKKKSVFLIPFEQFYNEN